LRDLENDIRQYEALKTGASKILEMDSLEELPKALIQARIAAGLAQDDLADRLGMKPQQIQRYEATDYQTASFARIREVARALGLRVRESVELVRT
jgi:ribosome-binding protein aMBF1 (putative translation factor)